MTGGTGPVPRSDEARVVVYTREGCHLCGAAEAVVAEVCADVGADWARVDVDADPDLVRRFSDMVPVTFVDGRQHDFFRVTPERLRRALGAGR